MANATRDYFGGKSHSHPRLVKQRQLLKESKNKSSLKEIREILVYLYNYDGVISDKKFVPLYDESS